MTLILKDITVSGFRDEFVSYEIDKLRPNYGSSSDLLRYEILAKYVGFYCDCTDVGPGVTPLSGIFNKNFYRDTIYLDHCPQQPDAPVAKLQVFGINELGNDTFIVTTGNQAMSKVLDKAHKNYNFSVLGLTVDHIEAHSGSNLKNITIKRTGPGLVRQVLLGDISCQQQGDGSLVSGDKRQRFVVLEMGLLN